MNDLHVRPDIGDSFFERAALELKRAERYHLFVSLLVLDLSFTRDLDSDQRAQLVDELLQVVEDNIRVFDNVSVIAEHKLALLFPETSRQGAEIAVRRLNLLIHNMLVRQARVRIDPTIPIEMASYPDAAGAKTVTDFLLELLEQSSN